MNKIVLILLAASALAQNTDVLYEPKHLTGDRANRAISFVNQIMAGRASITFEPVLRQVLIKGPKDDAAQALQLVQKYDVPEVKKEAKVSQVEYTIHLVGAFSTTGHSRGGPMLPDVEAAIQQMKNTLPYKEYRLLDTIPLTVRANGSPTEYSGILPAGAVGTNEKYFYKAAVGSSYVGEDGKTVGNSMMSFYVTIPNPSGKNGEVGIRTDLQIREGQKVVLGKIKLDNGDDAVFLVVTVKTR